MDSTPVLVKGQFRFPGGVVEPVCGWMTRGIRGRLEVEVFIGDQFTELLRKLFCGNLCSRFCWAKFRGLFWFQYFPRGALDDFLLQFLFAIVAARFFLLRETLLPGGEVQRPINDFVLGRQFDHEVSQDSPFNFQLLINILQHLGLCGNIENNVLTGFLSFDLVCETHTLPLILLEDSDLLLLKEFRNIAEGFTLLFICSISWEQDRYFVDASFLACGFQGMSHGIYGRSTPRVSSGRNRTHCMDTHTPTQ